jgi:very-short-patch-repair endonuclease
MPRLARYDRHAVAAILNEQDQVISRKQALACGMSAEALRLRLRPDGPWQVVLPGVYLTQTGALRYEHRIAAAFLHAGAGLAITGLGAAARHGIPCDPGEFVDVLVPHDCKRTDVRFVRLHRTTVVPKTYNDGGFVPFAAPARAVADAARLMTDLTEVRALVAAAVQRRRASIWQLAEELTIGPRQGSALLRRALTEVADGVRSTAEGDLRTLIKRDRLPEPLYNPSLYVGEDFLASPDAWWRDAGVAAEVDSKEYHLSPEQWAKTTDRHARMTAQGILVLHFPPSKIRGDGGQVAQQIRSALESSRGPLPQIRTVPARGL